MGQSCTTCSNGTHYTQIEFGLPTMDCPTVNHAASAAHRVDGLADRRRGGGWPVRECALAGTSRTARETTPNNRQHTGARDRRGTAFLGPGKIILAPHVGVSGVEAFPLKLKRSRAQHCRRRKLASGRTRTAHARGLNLRARLRRCSHARRIGKTPISFLPNRSQGRSIRGFSAFLRSAVGTGRSAAIPARVECTARAAHGGHPPHPAAGGPPGRQPGPAVRGRGGCRRSPTVPESVRDRATVRRARRAMHRQRGGFGSTNCDRTS